MVGIDVGGSVIKGARVNVNNGLLADRIEELTAPARTPTVVARQVASIVARCGGEGPVGVTLPGVIRNGVVERAANLSKWWAGCNAVELLESAVERPVVVLNDADAAGIAEIQFGAGRNQNGQVLMLTFGTGIGSALFERGQLFSRTELGHISIDGRPGEFHAALRAMHRERLTWQQWAMRANHYLAAVETVLYPDLIIIGGGVSLHADEWWNLVRTRTECVLAGLRNDAGMVGAAMTAHAALIRPIPGPR
ncbi:MAG: ROK family protein [Actinomycetota bacterium]|nr:ROK family protein [Actinomycetota bacterium]